jgi:ATP-dependent protease HslVU (ClpYQ) ATPase subunit
VVDEVGRAVALDRVEAQLGVEAHEAVDPLAVQRQLEVRYQLDVVAEEALVDLVDQPHLAGEARAEVERVGLVEVDHATVRQVGQQPLHHGPRRAVLVAVDPD